MDELLEKFKSKLLSLSKSTDEIQYTFNEVMVRLESVEFPVNGDSLAKMLVDISSRLSVIESDIKDMKTNIQSNTKDIDSATERLDDHDAKTDG